MNDQQLIDMLQSDSVTDRSSALELLASSYCNAPAMIGSIFEAWDRYGVAEAFPEFAQLSHLPAHHQYMATALDRAQAMSEGRKLVDPVCRCAGKIVEAMVLIPSDQLADFMPRIESLKKSSKIFFRIDTDHLCKRIALSEMSDEELLAILDPSPMGIEENVILPDAIYALEALHERGEADELLRRWFSVPHAWESEQPQRLPIILQVASRHALLGHEESLVAHVDHPQAPMAASACIALARCRSQSALEAISERFASASPTAQLRMADILGRLRLPGASQQIHQLRNESLDPKVHDALNLAELLHFDFSQIDNWLEALFILSDSTMRRYRNLVFLAQRLAERQEEPVRRHISEGLKIRQQS